LFLGGSHDNGYARLLSKLEIDNITPGKVSLLEGPPFAAELQRVDVSTFPRVKFGNLFEDVKLETNPTSNLKYAQVAADGVLRMSPKSPSATSASPKKTTFSHKSVKPDHGIYPHSSLT